MGSQRLSTQTTELSSSCFERCDYLHQSPHKCFSSEGRHILLKSAGRGIFKRKPFEGVMWRCYKAVYRNPHHLLGLLVPGHPGRACLRVLF